jgi:hypothetical protein
MYEPHNSVWLVLGFVFCALLFAVLTLQQRRGTWVLPKGLPVACLTVGSLLLVGALALRSFDNSRLIEELRAVPAGDVQKLVVSRAGLTKTVSNATEISQFLTLLQSAARIAAHHSHPTDEFDLTFEVHDQRFHYRLGRDSERFDEVWVLRPSTAADGGPERELGRVRSEKLSAMAEVWLRQGRTP